MVREHVLEHRCTGPRAADSRRNEYRRIEYNPQSSVFQGAKYILVGVDADCLGTWHEAFAEPLQFRDGKIAAQRLARQVALGYAGCRALASEGTVEFGRDT